MEMKLMHNEIALIFLCAYQFYTRAQLFKITKNASITSSSTTLGQTMARSMAHCAIMCSCNDLINCCAATYRDEDKSCTLNSDCQRETIAMLESDVLTKYPGSCNYVWKDCQEVNSYGGQNGVYPIHPLTSLFVDVYCENTIDGGGWIVIQRRIDGSVNFTRNWDEYTNGFGDKDGEYWLGNELVHQLTSSGSNYQLRVEMVKTDNQKVYVQYDTFSLGIEASGYALNILGYSGTAGDSLNYHNGHSFSTYDFDNDNWAGIHCAACCGGAWWHNACSDTALNNDFSQGQEWDNVGGSIRTSVMMIRKN